MATTRNIIGSARASWESVCQHVSKAVVFMDGPMAECLHWCVGAGMLLRAGAINLKQFSSFESATSEQRKAVFVVSGLLADTVEDTIVDIVRSSDFQYCIVITAVPHSLHAHLLGDGMGDANTEGALFLQFENKLRRWMGGPIAEAEVHHVPLFAAPICPSLFVVPAHRALFPMLTSDLSRVQENRDSRGDKKPSDKYDDIELHMLPKELQQQIKMLVSGLSGFCEQLKVSEDVYAIGHTSRIVANELAGLPSAKARRKAAQHRASVLLVDRSLDMAGASSHLSRETLADRILSHLHRLPEHSVDVAVNMADLLSLASDQADPSLVVYPGCLSHPSDPVSQALLNTLVTTKQKESVMDVNRQLVDCISKEKLPLKMGGKLGRIGAETIQTHLQLFKNNPESLRRNTGLLQMAAACAQTLTHPDEPAWEGALRSEKLLLQGMAEASEPPSLQQILTILEEAAQTYKPSHSLDTILLLLVFAYSLAGDDSASFDADERSLKSLLIQAILLEQEPSEFMTEFVGSRRNEDTARDAVNRLFNTLRGLSKARGHLQQFRSVLDRGSLVTPASYDPLLRQVLEAVFSPSKPELPDVEYKSTGLRDLIKTGFRFFVNVSKPRPSDHPLLVVFVLGGVTCSEVRTVRDTVAAHSPNTQVVVGSTSILRPIDVLKVLLSQPTPHQTTS